MVHIISEREKLLQEYRKLNKQWISEASVSFGWDTIVVRQRKAGYDFSRAERLRDESLARQKIIKAQMSAITVTLRTLGTDPVDLLREERADLLQRQRAGVNADVSGAIDQRVLEINVEIGELTDHPFVPPEPVVIETPTDRSSLLRAIDRLISEIKISQLGFEAKRSQLATLTELSGRLRRGEITFEQAISVFNSLNTFTKEDVEIIGDDPPPDLTEYYVLTPAQDIINPDGTITKKIRTLSIRPLTEEQVKQLTDLGHDVALASSIDIISYAKLFDSPIRLQGSTDIINDVISGDSNLGTDPADEDNPAVDIDDPIIMPPPQPESKSGLGIIALLLVMGS